MEEKPNLEKIREVKIVWGDADDLPALFANHLAVSHMGVTEFNLVFGYLSPPLIPGLNKEELPETIKIKPVARLVITPEAMKDFLKALNDNFERYEKTVGKTEK